MSSFIILSTGLCVYPGGIMSATFIGLGGWELTIESEKA